MINIRTEYSFKKVFGHIDAVAKRCSEVGLKAAAIADIDNTFGHVQWKKACAKYGIHPCYGVQLRVYEAPLEKERKAKHHWITLVAKNDQGLKELYALVSLAYSEDHFYYTPRLHSKELIGKENIAAFSYKNTVAQSPQQVSWRRVLQPIPTKVPKRGC